MIPTASCTSNAKNAAERKRLQTYMMPKNATSTYDVQKWRSSPWLLKILNAPMNDSQKCCMHPWCPNMNYEIFLKYNVRACEAKQLSLEQWNICLKYAVCTHDAHSTLTKTSRNAAGMIPKTTSSTYYGQKCCMRPWCPKILHNDAQNRCGALWCPQCWRHFRWPKNAGLEGSWLGFDRDTAMLSHSYIRGADTTLTHIHASMNFSGTALFINKP